MLTPLSALASEQSAPTEATMEKCLQFLDYAASQEDAILTYKASDMVLAIHSDASYLSEPKARSRAGGHMFMAGKEEIPINNGAVLNISQIIKAVSSPHCSSTPKWQYQCVKRSKNLATRKCERRCKPTTRPLMPCSPIKSSRRRSKPWICDSIGYDAAMLRANIGIIGDLEPKTWLTTGRSTTQQATTNRFDHKF
jgi:hypothetical protein